MLHFIFAFCCSRNVVPNKLSRYGHAQENIPTLADKYLVSVYVYYIYIYDAACQAQPRDAFYGRIIFGGSSPNRMRSESLQMH